MGLVHICSMKSCLWGSCVEVVHVYGAEHCAVKGLVRICGVCRAVWGGVVWKWYMSMVQSTVL